MTFTESIKAEIERFLATPLTSMSLRRLSKFCQGAAQLVLLTEKAEKASVATADAILQGGDLVGGTGDYSSGGGLNSGDDDDDQSPGTYTPSSNSENFGTKVVREILAMAPAIFQQQHETPLALVSAIREAREAGMTDVAAELEKKLTGRKLDGDRPVKPGLAVRLAAVRPVVEIPQHMFEPLVENSFICRHCDKLDTHEVHDTPEPIVAEPLPEAKY